MPSSGAAVVLISWLVSIIFIFHVLSLRGQGFAAAGRNKWKWLGVALVSCIPFLGIPAYLYFLIRVRPGVVRADADYIQAKRRQRAKEAEARAAAAKQQAATEKKQAAAVPKSSSGASSFTVATTGSRPKQLVTNKCPSCQDGLTTCFSCNRSGRIWDSALGETMTCNACGGRGGFMCSRCGGRGSIQEYV